LKAKEEGEEIFQVGGVKNAGWRAASSAGLKATYNAGLKATYIADL
jgi:hypothetical protein